MPPLADGSPMLTSAALPWRDGSGRLRVTAIVKVTYELRPGGLAVIAPPRPLSEDVPRDRSRPSSLLVASDFVPLKRHAEVMVVGHVHPARPGATRQLVEVALARGARVFFAKRLVAVGDRASPEDPPAPLRALPLSYERAFAGDWNPVGFRGGGERGAPSFCDPARPGAPAGLGPVAPSWPGRAGYLPAGLDGERALRDRPLSLPSDLDVRFFQSAPPEQWIPFLRGGEQVRLVGLHADLPVTVCRLPAIHAFARLGGPGARGEVVPLVGDTLWIDMDALAACVTYRGSVEVGARPGPSEALDHSQWMVTAALAPCEAIEETVASPRGWTGRGPGRVAPTTGSKIASPSVDPVSIQDLSGFAVGCVPWSPAPGKERRTVVAKLTLELPADGGALPIAREQAPLRGDEEASEDEGAPLLYPTDHAPMKPKADVLVRGTAQGSLGKSGAPVSLRVGSLEARLDRLSAAGFGAVSPASAARRAVAGSFDRAWQRHRWPCLPADFDPAYFQAAPADLQTAHLRGDERFRVLGVRPEGGAVEGALPGVRPRAFVLREGGEPEEVALALDTVLFDVEASRAFLVFRGSFDLAEGRAPMRVIVVRDEVARPRSREDILNELCARGDLSAHPGVEPQKAAGIAASYALGDALRETLKLAGNGAGGAAAALRRPRPPSPPAPPGPDEIAARLRDGKGLSGLDLTGADLRGLDLSNKDLRGALLAGANLTGARLSGADLTGARLAGIVAADSAWDRANLTRADLARARLTRANMVGATVRQATFSGADLSGACLDEASGEGASFVGASLSGARADGARLPKADFTEANLEEASLRGASLEDARWYTAVVRKAVLDEATLTDARFEKVDLTGASLRGARAKGAVWECADLSGATLSGADVTEAVFSGAALARADLRGVSARRGVFREADLTQARLDGADLMRATFEGACLRGAVLRGANLHEAETWKANVDGADLTGAIVTGSKLAKAAT